jgi:hypothetical protein
MIQVTQPIASDLAWILMDVENIINVEHPAVGRQCRMIGEISLAISKFLQRFQIIAGHGCRHAFACTSLKPRVRSKIKALGYTLHLSTSREPQAADQLLKERGRALKNPLLIKNVSVVALVSGDGGYITLIDRLREDGYCVVTFAWQDFLNRNMRKSADQLVTLESLGLRNLFNHLAF